MRTRSETADLDRSLKALIRRFPPAFLRLAGLEVAPANVRLGDVSVNLPEYRADQVFIVSHDDGRPRYALHLEYQLQPPDAAGLQGWFLKNAGLTAQLQLPVFLIALYLTRGRRRRFPASYRVEDGPLVNEFSFHAIRLWEHADRIRSGDLREFAPLLVLCEDSPEEGLLQEERALIRRLDVPADARADLLAVALTVASRYFARDLLLDVFREELPMLKEASIVHDWIEEGIERGIEQGIERGEAGGTRRILTRLLRERFGPLPSEVTARIGEADASWCEETAVRALSANSLQELGF